MQYFRIFNGVREQNNSLWLAGSCRVAKKQRHTDKARGFNSALCWRDYQVTALLKCTLFSVS